MWGSGTLAPHLRANRVGVDVHSKGRDPKVETPRTVLVGVGSHFHVSELLLERFFSCVLSCCPLVGVWCCCFLVIDLLVDLHCYINTYR